MKCHRTKQTPRTDLTARVSISRLSRVAAIALLVGFTYEASAQSIDFDIDAQQTDDTLLELAETAGIQIAFATDRASKSKSPPIMGPHSIEEALSEALQGTGLDYQFANADFVVVTEDDVRGVQAGSVRAASAVLTSQLAQLQVAASQAATSAERSRRSDEVGTSVITGKVTDARTGANLKGAKVTIEETGQWTSTDDLGEFRFVNVSMGSTTLTVSYLGYAGQSTVVDVRAPSVSQSFALRGGSELEEIVVFGQRSARAIALNQERTAINSQTVLSSDHLGQFNGTTISEALRRAPGIAFIPDEITGEGANVIVRGLEPDLNQVVFNGQRLLDGSGLGRAPNLSNILTESIDKVTINKSLLPSQDSSGAGAVIEIETKGPLDRDRRFARFGVEYGETGSDFGDEFGINGTLSGRFGQAEDFGASLSVAYREREIDRLSYSVDFPTIAVLPLDSSGNPVLSPLFIDPRTSFPFEEGLDRIYPTQVFGNSSESEVETILANLSLQKTFRNDTTLRLDIDFAEEVRTQYAAVTRTSSNPVPSAVAPFAGVTGERAGVISELEDGLIQGGVTRGADYMPDQESQNFAVNLRGESSLDQWSFDYSLGLTTSSQDRPRGLSVSTRGTAFVENQFGGLFVGSRESGLFSNAVLDNLTDDGRIISIFQPLSGDENVFVSPLFSEAGFQFYNDIDAQQVQQLRVLPARDSEGDAFTVSFDARRSFDFTNLKYLSVGFNYQDTTFSSLIEPDDPSVFASASTGITTADIGLSFGPSLLDRVGAPGDLFGLSRQSVEGVLGNVDSILSNETLFDLSLVNVGDETRTETTESTLATYFEGQLVFSRLEVTGGIRFEAIEVGSTSFVFPTVIDVDFSRPPEVREAGRLITESVDQLDVLPRLLANYRISEDMLVRAGYYRTVSRPQLRNLTQRRDLFLALPPSFSQAGDRPLFLVFQGNPDLEPATTDNYSLDWEWYFDDIGAIKIAGFYKVTKNPLQNNVTVGGLELLPEDLVLPTEVSFFNPLPDPIEIQVSQPVNDPDDNAVLGVEVVAERQLTFLPGIWSGLGIYANYTYTDSETERELTFRNSEGVEEEVSIVVPYNDAPEHQGTLGLVYNKYGVDATLFYSRQSRRFASLSAFGLNSHNESVETLDLRVEYLFPVNGSTVRAYFRGKDLLRSDDEPFLRKSIGGENGVPKYYTGGDYFGGRSYFVGASVTFQ